MEEREIKYGLHDGKIYYKNPELVSFSMTQLGSKDTNQRERGKIK